MTTTEHDRRHRIQHIQLDNEGTGWKDQPERLQLFRTKASSF